MTDYVMHSTKVPLTFPPLFMEFFISFFNISLFSELCPALLSSECLVFRVMSSPIIQ